MDDCILRKLKFKAPKAELKDWESFVGELKEPSGRVTIGLCGKYVHLKDSYKSIIEAFQHAGVSNEVAVELRFIDSEEVEEKGPEEMCRGIDGLLVPGGFGQRGIEGKIAAVRYARENELPYFGICLGLQIATVEFARNVMGLKGANSSEFDPETPHPVIDILPTKRGIEEMGGTLRLGAYPCKLEAGSLARKIYGRNEISERHRHRYEITPKYVKKFNDNGLRISGVYEKAGLSEIVEIPEHPWLVPVQFHPEFKSQPTRPHPLFDGFVGAAVRRHASRAEKSGEAPAREEVPARPSPEPGGPTSDRGPR